MKTPTRMVAFAIVSSLLMFSTTHASISVIGGLTHEKSVKPGQIYRGSILIKNCGIQTQEVKIYQTDYHFSFDGTNVYGPPGEATRSNAAWVSFNPHRLIIPASDTLRVNYTANVPDAAALVGTYWSMLMVEGVPQGSSNLAQAEAGETKLSITQIVRYGVQMITHIDNTGHSTLEFLDTRLLRENESRVLQVDLENSGERWLRPTLWVEIYDLTGSYLGRFAGGTKRTFPGTSVRYRLDLSDVPQGEYIGLLVADCGGDSVFGTKYTLKLEQ